MLKILLKKIRYSSRYSDKSVTAAQYITELICEHKAAKEGKDLYYRFWNNAEWSRFFRNQVSTANKLISKYGDKAIIRALNDYRCKKIFSLRAPSLTKIIEEKVLEIQSENQVLTKEFLRTENHSYRQNKSKKNILDKLEDIDNDEN